MDVPTYALYGEFLEQSAPDYLHYESIRERSLRHNWTIRPHRHDGLMQFFLFETPGVRIQMGEAEVCTREPVALLMPPLVVHAFQFPMDMHGAVISLATRHFQRSLERTGVDPQNLLHPRIFQKKHESFPAIGRITDEIRREFDGIRRLRNDALEALMHCLIVLLCRECGEGDMTGTFTSRREEQVRQFCGLVETDYAANRDLEAYASDLGISRIQLYRVCRHVLGKAPGEVIRSRRLIEAKRQLEFTHMSIAEIGGKLGFRDAAYFSRFFKQCEGHTPSEHRARFGKSV